MERFQTEAQGILNAHKISESYCCACLLDAEGSIGSFEANSIYRALATQNGSRNRDVLLVLLSTGGSIEPAYQIAKLCKSYTRDRFVVVVPREAKSAATLIAIGADEIHLGPLGQLGPIDPQLGGLPALGVVQALKTISNLCGENPGSAEMFARYLKLSLTVEQIGYSQRIAESAVQYAERLLLTKPSLQDRAHKAAYDLVYEYKHHGFVIDRAEAQAHLGHEWIKTDTPELALAEALHDRFYMVNLFLSVYRKMRLICVGRLDTGALVMKKP